MPEHGGRRSALTSDPRRPRLGLGLPGTSHRNFDDARQQRHLVRSWHDATLSEDAEPTQAASTAALTRHPLRLSNVALNAPRRLQGGNRDRSGLDVNTSGSASSRTVTQHASARAADSVLQLRASPAAPFKRGCGGTTGNLNLAGDLAGSGGLLGATTEEARQEGIRTEPAAGTQNTAYNSSNNSDILGGSSAHSSGSDHQQQ